MGASIKLMLGRCMSVKKDNGSSNVEWNHKFRMLDGKGDVMIEGVLLHRDVIVSELVLVEERM